MRCADALAIALHQAGELADARRQQRLDALAQTTRQHRRRAAGADRHHDVAAIDDRRHDESGEIGPVDHVDRNAHGARTCGDGVIARSASGRDNSGRTSDQSADNGSPVSSVGGRAYFCRGGACSGTW